MESVAIAKLAEIDRYESSRDVRDVTTAPNLSISSPLNASKLTIDKIIAIEFVLVIRVFMMALLLIVWI